MKKIPPPIASQAALQSSSTKIENIAASDIAIFYPILF
jgi:hypothetical protein